ncbi:MAG: FtsX-like permease family protein [Microthrixaceae bacterium]
MSPQAPTPGGSLGFWLRWSWRDLRRQWVAVVAIGLVMAIGIGVYAGLGSTSAWRRLSNDASFASLNMHDLRISLSPGTFTPEGTLAAVIAGIEGADSVAAADERLVTESQVDASHGDESVLVVARLVGMDLGAGAAVDRVWVSDGTAPDRTSGDAAGVLEVKFAEHRELPDSGSLTIAGSHEVRYAGLGMNPEDFYYEGPEGSVLSEGELAPVYLPLALAQQITDRPGAVNDAVMTLADGADRDEVAAQLVDGLDAAGVSATVTTADDAYAFRVLYEDIDNDQRFWNAIAGLVLVAAALGALNLISRIVEAQRREIGIGMALGVPRWKLSIRPLLIGTQIAALGTVAGIGVGILVGRAMKSLLVSFLPLPEYVTPFQFDVYGRAAVLGLLIPVVAAAVPVWRAVRVEPIEAIRTGHLAARTSRLSDWTRRFRLPGSSLTQMPFRNVFRAPRRSLLTALGVGAAIVALVAVLGMLDSFGRTIDRAGDEFTRGDPDRVLVQLDTFHAADSELVGAIAEQPTVGATDVGLRLPATALATDGADDLVMLVEFVDFADARWAPTVETPASVGGNPGSTGEGIVLSRKAADDLGVAPGGTLRLSHPARDGPASFAQVESDLTVSGIHANPIRPFAYLDLAQADRFGLGGLANVVHAYPAQGATSADVQRSVFALPGVASSQAVVRISESFDEALAQFVGFLAIAGVAVLLLALLIAFNAARITVDERRREHATMRAFGLPVRTVLVVLIKESVLVGLAATAVGVAAGTVFLDWMLASLASTTLPDLGIDRYVSPSTVVVAASVGIVAVAAAPLFLIRRIRRMDIPDTLRVME